MLSNELTKFIYNILQPTTDKKDDPQGTAKPI